MTCPELSEAKLDTGHFHLLNDGRARECSQNGGLGMSVVSFLQQSRTSGLAAPIKTSSNYQILCFLKPPPLISQGNYQKKSLIKVTLGEKLMEESDL